jgi:hypothetical protein
MKSNIKKIILLFIVIINSKINAQNELWPESKAEWHYTYTDNMWFEGFTKYKIDRDTIINSQFCQIYSRKAKWVFTGLPEIVVDSIYNNNFAVLSLLDSVLLKFNFRTNLFDTIINFKANENSRWRTTIDDSICLATGVFITTEVLEKNIITFNGRNLLKFKLLRNVPAGYGNSYTEDFQQYIGSDIFFIHNYICIDKDFAIEKKLRCFKNFDQNYPFEYEYSLEECDFVSNTLELKNNTSLEKINLYPNPNKGSFVLQSNEKIDTQKLKITSIDGKLIPFNLDEKENNLHYISLTDFKEGVYLIEVHFSSNQKRVIKKLNACRELYQ